MVVLLAGALAGCGSGVDDRPATWSFISPAIIQPSCATASCHSDAGQRAGVILAEPKEGYDVLTSRFFVVPGQPAQSEMVALMRARGARRMPPDFALPEADIQLIERWIEAGAGPE